MSVALITAREGESIRRADLSMRYAEIRHLPVLDDKGRLVGIVSDRDFLRAFARTRRRGRILVGGIMMRPVRTVRPETPAGKAAGLLLKHKIGALAVIDRPGHLVGLITETDFLRVFMLEASHGKDDTRSRSGAGSPPEPAAHAA